MSDHLCSHDVNDPVLEKNAPPERSLLGAAARGDVDLVDQLLTDLLPGALVELERACDMLVDRVYHRLASSTGEHPSHRGPTS